MGSSKTKQLRATQFKKETIFVCSVPIVTSKNCDLFSLFFPYIIYIPVRVCSTRLTLKKPSFIHCFSLIFVFHCLFSFCVFFFLRLLINILLFILIGFVVIFMFIRKYERKKGTFMGELSVIIMQYYYVFFLLFFFFLLIRCIYHFFG